MMFKRNLVSVSIASILLASSVTASANTGSSEEEDSVNSWGKWAQNFATAAGGEVNTAALALAFASLGQGETGRNNQNEPGIETPDAVGCEAGAFCGFATIFSTSDRAELAMDGGEGGGIKPVDDVGVFTADFSVVEGSEPTPVGRSSSQPRSLPIEGSFGITGNEGYDLAVDGAEGSIERDYLSMYQGDKDDNANVKFYDFHPLWALAEGSWDSSDGSVYTSGDVWAGVTTSIDQLNDYIGKNGTIASYSGITLDGGTFAATIDFGNKSWNGAWNGGVADGNISTSATNVSGQVAFAVTGGAIDGINFSAGSSNLSAGDGEVTGSVNGAIFGGHAQSVAGMVDIVKSTDSYSNLEHETLFAGINNALVSVPD